MDVDLWFFITLLIIDVCDRIIYNTHVIQEEAGYWKNRVIDSIQWSTLMISSASIWRCWKELPFYDYQFYIGIPLCMFIGYNVLYDPEDHVMRGILHMLTIYIVTILFTAF